MKRLGFLNILDERIVHVHHCLDGFLCRLFVSHLHFVAVAVCHSLHDNRLAKVDSILKQLQHIAAGSSKVAGLRKVCNVALVYNKLVNDRRIADLHVFDTAHFTAEVFVHIFRNPWCTHFVEDIHKRNALRHRLFQVGHVLFISVVILSGSTGCFQLFTDIAAQISVTVH